MAITTREFPLPDDFKETPQTESGGGGQRKSQSSTNPTDRRESKRDRGEGHKRNVPPEPPPPMDHWITDADLQMLLDAARDGFSDRFTLFLGLGVGLATSCADPTWEWLFGKPSVPLSVPHEIELLATVACLSVAGTIQWAARKKKSRPQALAEELRARHKKPELDENVH